MTIPAVVQAQFVYTTNNGTITITGYIGTPTTLTIPSTINGYPVTSIGECAFCQSTSLTSITIGNSVTSIGSSAFYYCTSLTNLTIGNSVTNIGSSAFYYCTSLTNLTIGNSVTNIGDSAFGSCYSLASITIPNTVTSIGDMAFDYCNSLTSITIGNSVTSIGSQAFYYCTSLTSVYFEGNTPSLGVNVFSYAFDATVYYFSGTTGWASTFGGRPTVCLLLPLVITIQPQSRTNNVGATVTFHVSATSPTPMGYQWQKNGTGLADGGKVSGANTNTLSIMSISDSDAAIYAVVLTNSYGSMTSSDATLTVIDPPVITAQPPNMLVLQGTNVTFRVSVIGLPAFLRYQWRFNGTNLVNATSAHYAIPSVGTNNAGNYSVMITNAAGIATSSNASLTVVVSPRSQTHFAGSTAMFTATAFHPESLNYQWQKNGTNLVDGNNISGATNSTLTIASVSDADAASYSAVVSNATSSVTTSNAVLTVIDPPTIMAQPTSLLVLQGTNATFGVSVSGTAPLRYQWRFNGTNLVNATTANYAIPSVGTNNAGNYSVMITNAAGIATSSNASLTVVVSPRSQTHFAGSTAMFTATAFHPESLNYQWQKNGTNLVDGGNISGATNSTLTITGISDSDAGTYCKVVTNAYGSVTTSNAILTVNNLPFLTTQPQSLVTLVGSNVTFTAAAYGAPPLMFQWYFNGLPVGSLTIGTNCSTYTLAYVGTNQSGNYIVKVVNGYGSATSSNATLTVAALPPIITMQPTNQAVKPGNTATFSILASSVSQMNYQWRKNDINLGNGGRISGATSNTLIITAVSSSDAGIYSVRVTNLAGSVTSSNATLTLMTPPSITMQPLGQRMLVGGSVSFNVSLNGTAPFSYRWRFNGANILNGTNAVYTIQAVTTTNTGQYSVVVTNLLGSVTSSNAVLTVIVPPTLELELWAGHPLLSLGGMLSNNFVVEYSTNVAGTNWINLLSLTNLPFSPYQFLDTTGDEEPGRFYRAFMQ